MKTRKRVFKGTSVPVEDVYRYIDCGGEEEYEIKRFLDACPEVSREQLEAWLESQDEQRLYETEVRAAQTRANNLALLLIVALGGATVGLVVWVCWIVIGAPQ